MLMNRFYVEYNYNTYNYDVVDLVTGKCIETFTHEWRAYRFAEHKINECIKNGEPFRYTVIHNIHGKIIKIFPEEG